jgi:aldehyde dehydrogenase (NAD+)
VGVVSFTGSTTVGRLVSEACAPAFKHCHLEMGGKNIIMVMDDARLDLAVDGAVWGGFGTTGQRCTAASRVAVHKKVYAEFMERFAARTRALRVGNGLDSKVHMGPCISESQRRTVEKYVKIGREEGAKLVCGGSPLRDGEHAKGFFHEPTIFGDCSPEMRVSCEEIFGPVVAVMEARDFEEAVAMANDSRFGLSASVVTRDLGLALRFIKEIDAGIVHVNSQTAGAEPQVPFGGFKGSSSGTREQGKAAREFFTQIKTVYLDPP